MNKQVENNTINTSAVGVTKKHKFTEEECELMVLSGFRCLDLVHRSSSWMKESDPWRRDFIKQSLEGELDTHILMALYHNETGNPVTPYHPALKNKFFTTKVEKFKKELKELFDAHNQWLVEKEEREAREKRIAERNAVLSYTTAELAKSLGVSKAAIRVAKANGKLQKDQWGQYKIVA